MFSLGWLLAADQVGSGMEYHPLGRLSIITSEPVKMSELSADN